VIQLYVVAGPAASGKSEFSKILSEKSGNTWLDFDENIDELIETNKDLIKTEGMEFFLRKFREVSLHRIYF
jgi:shikimate kinase